MLPTKIIQEKLLVQNSCSNGHLPSFDVLIIVYVIFPNAELLVDSGYRQFQQGSTMEIWYNCK